MKIQIDIPKGFKIKSFDKETGTIQFEESPVNIMDRIKTVDDVLKDNGLAISTYDGWQTYQSNDEVAYRLLKLICKSLNEGWEPDWDDHKQEKYSPWFEMGGSSGFRYYYYDDWDSDSTVGSRLCFKSKELAEYAGKQFTEVYKQYMTY